MRFAMLSVLLCLAIPALAEQLPEEPHITVLGHKKLEVVPDLLEVSLLLEMIHEDVGVASESVESRTVELVNGLLALGIDAKDISSARLTITPRYSWDGHVERFIGTNVSRTIEIMLRDLEKYDPFVRLIIQSKVVQINNTVLKSSNEASLQREALQGALQDAREKAESLVSEIEAEIGGIYSISSESRGAIYDQRYMIAGGKGDGRRAESAFEPGTIDFHEAVTVVFYLKN